MLLLSVCGYCCCFRFGFWFYLALCGLYTSQHLRDFVCACVLGQKLRIVSCCSQSDVYAALCDHISLVRSVGRSVGSLVSVFVDFGGTQKCGNVLHCRERTTVHRVFCTILLTGPYRRSRRSGDDPVLISVDQRVYPKKRVQQYTFAVDTGAQTTDTHQSTGVHPIPKRAQADTAMMRYHLLACCLL